MWGVNVGLILDGERMMLSHWACPAAQQDAWRYTT
mgnify:CR=1 FL=1